MIQWLHNFIPQPILLQWGWLTVYWYGLIVAVAIIVGVLVVSKMIKNQSWPIQSLDGILFWGLLGGLVGARLYHVILEWSYYRTDFLAIVKVWHGGLAIHGAWLGGLLVIYFIARHYKLSLFKLLDILVVGLVFGQAIGRWGNFFNQELFGLPTSLPWGIYIDLVNRPISYLLANYFHPTFLYESLLNLALFLILYLVYKKRKELIGLTTSVYLIGYSLIRFSLEFIRIDKTPEFWGLRWPQWFSLIIIGLVVLYWFLLRTTLSKSKKPV